MNTVEKLERLGEIKKAIEKLKADETAEIETILTPEIRAEIEKIYSHFVHFLFKHLIS